MENIEQLKADNAKLTERLNNAAKFFKEQKAQIESLIKENEELKRIPKDDSVSTEKWNALVTEKESLNKQLNEYELKLQDSETAYEQLHKKYEERKKQVAELMGSQAANVETIKNEYELKLQKLEGDYKDLKKVYEDERSEYENKITLLEEDNIKLGKNVHEQKEYIEKMAKEHEQVVNDLKKENKDTEEQFNKVLETYEKDLKEAKEEIKALNMQLGEAEEQYDKLSIKHEKYANFVSTIIAAAEECNFIDKQQVEAKISVIKNDQTNTGNVFMKDAPEFTI